MVSIILVQLSYICSGSSKEVFALMKSNYFGKLFLNKTIALWQQQWHQAAR
jgi:hypothetical protein